MSAQVVSQQDRKERFNPYVWVDPAKESEAFQLQEVFYNSLLLITHLAIGYIFNSTIAFCAVYAPLHLLIIAPLTEKAEEARKNTEIAMGILTKMNEIEANCLSFIDYRNYFTQCNIDTASIAYSDKLTLTSIDSNRICYRALIAPLARVSYWSDKASELEKELTQLEEERLERSFQHSGEMTPLNDSERMELLESMDETDKKREKLVQEEFLPAKIKAAFNLHLLANPSDLRSFEEFGTISLSNEEESYFYFKEQSKSPLTKKWLEGATIPEIAKKIYKDRAIVV